MQSNSKDRGSAVKYYTPSGVRAGYGSGNRKYPSGKEPNKIVTGLLIAAVLITAFIIYNFSSVNADVSSAQSGRFVTAFARFFKPDMDLLPEAELEEYLHNMTVLVRKLAHFTEFGALGFFLYLLLIRYKDKVYVMTVGLCAAYAVSDELHQLTSAGRSPQVTDVLIDTLGAACLAGVALGLTMLARKLRARKRPK